MYRRVVLRFRTYILILVCIGALGSGLALLRLISLVQISTIAIQGCLSVLQQNDDSGPETSLLTLAALSVHDCPVAQTPLESKEKVTSEDRAAIRTVIESQVAAFRNGDFAQALLFASPFVQHKFGSLQSYIEMIRSTYEPIIGPRSMVFEDLKQVMGVVTQPVLFFAQDGDLIIASYIMEKEGNGEWRISGCYLAPVK